MNQVSPGSDAGPVSGPDLGDLRRTRPISRSFGYERGTPVDRVLIESFLATHAQDVRGRTLEIGDDSYSAGFGGDRTTQRDVLHVNPNAPQATIIGDLAQENCLPADAFDCAVITQTLHLIEDVPAALRTLRRSLAPGGVLLATAPGVSQVSEDEWGPRWLWGFTSRSLARLARAVFDGPGDIVSVYGLGSAAASVCFLHGLGAEEIPQELLVRREPGRPTLLCLRAVRS